MKKFFFFPFLIFLAFGLSVSCVKTDATKIIPHNNTPVPPPPGQSVKVTESAAPASITATVGDSKTVTLTFQANQTPLQSITVTLDDSASQGWWTTSSCMINTSSSSCSINLPLNTTNQTNRTITLTFPFTVNGNSPGTTIPSIQYTVNSKTSPPTVSMTSSSNPITATQSTTELNPAATLTFTVTNNGNPAQVTNLSVTITDNPNPPESGHWTSISANPTSIDTCSGTCQTSINATPTTAGSGNLSVTYNYDGLANPITQTIPYTITANPPTSPIVDISYSPKDFSNSTLSLKPKTLTVTFTNKSTATLSSFSAGPNTFPLPENWTDGTDGCNNPANSILHANASCTNIYNYTAQTILYPYPATVPVLNFSASWNSGGKTPDSRFPYSTVFPNSQTNPVSISTGTQAAIGKFAVDDAGNTYVSLTNGFIQIIKNDNSTIKCTNSPTSQAIAYNDTFHEKTVTQVFKNKDSTYEVIANAKNGIAFFKFNPSPSTCTLDKYVPTYMVDTTDSSGKNIPSQSNTNRPVAPSTPGVIPSTTNYQLNGDDGHLFIYSADTIHFVKDPTATTEYFKIPYSYYSIPVDPKDPTKGIQLPTTNFSDMVVSTDQSGTTPPAHVFEYALYKEPTAVPPATDPFQHLSAWSFSCPMWDIKLDGDSKSVFGTGVTQIGPPLVTSGNKNIYVGSVGGAIYSLSSDGSKATAITKSDYSYSYDINTSLAISDDQNYLFSAGADHIYGINISTTSPDSQKPSWSFPATPNTISNLGSPIFVTTTDTTPLHLVFFTATKYSKTHLYALYADTGNLLFDLVMTQSNPTANEKNSSQPVYNKSNNTIYFAADGDTSNEVLAISLNGMPAEPTPPSP